MITADPDTFLGYLCRKVDEMKPGQRIDVSIHDLRREIPSFDYGGAMFSAPDRVLENIVGSSYTHSYTVNHERSTVTFERHENTGARHYLSPDRRPADRKPHDPQTEILRQAARIALARYRGGVTSGE